MVGAIFLCCRLQPSPREFAGNVKTSGGALAGILATGRAPAYAQVTTLHWLRLGGVLGRAGSGVRFNEHLEAEGPLVFEHACRRTGRFVKLSDALAKRAWRERKRIGRFLHLPRPRPSRVPGMQCRQRQRTRAAPQSSASDESRRNFQSLADGRSSAIR